MTTQSKAIDPAAALREALEACERASNPPTWQYGESRGDLIVACRQHLPSLFAELDQLRELAKAAVEWSKGDCRGHMTLPADPKPLLDSVRAYAARQAEGANRA